MVDTDVLTVGSLFSGIGGLELGPERVGMDVRWQVEIDDGCREDLTAHWPDVKRYSDITGCGAHNLEPVDLICGGPPCQPVSVAGKRKGDEDERWLWDEFYRIIREIRPRWVVVENVPGLLSAGNGRLFAGILRDLAVSGYDAEWQVLSARAIGADHLRRRVFIVAYTNSDGYNSHNRRGVVCHTNEYGEGAVWEHQQQSRIERGGQTMAYTDGQRQSQPQGTEQDIGRRPIDSGQSMADASCLGVERHRPTGIVFAPAQAAKRLLRRHRTRNRSGIWKAEPAVGRLVDGVSDKLDK